MQLTDVLNQMGGLQSMARQLGVSDTQAASGAAALLPMILGGFKKQAQAQPAGIGDLGSLLNGLGGAGLLDEVLGAQPANVSRGNNVLGQIFGSPDVSRAVAQNAAGRTGLDPALLKKMLPILAMLVAGYMARQQSGAARSNLSGAGAAAGGAGALAGALGGLLGGGAAASAGSSGAGGIGGLASMLDLNGDGNPLDDIIGMAGKLMR
ncbi:MAG: DUF937 domain-containing protein [Sinobacteraceae bacterium]|nr:DUF937 domain-containing protein [Nevskiaceae bacterium]MCP5470823.1 DUF937 domain-containing protein [Nevskiaceae bacterium]